MLDKLTYSGNPGNLGTGRSSSSSATSATPDAVAAAARRLRRDRQLRGRDARRPLDPRLGRRDPDERDRHLRPARARARDRGQRLVHVSTDEVYGDVAPGRAVLDGADPLAPSSPYSAGKAGGDLQVLAHHRTYGVDALITRGSNTYGPNQYPEKLLPLFVTNALDGEPLPMYGDGDQMRDWLLRRGSLRRDRAGAAAGPAPARSTTSAAARRRRIARSPISCSSHTGADESLVRRVEDRPGHDRRYSLDTTKIRAAARLGAADRARRRLPADRCVVPRAPRLVGADQALGRLPRVLRQAVRGPPRRLALVFLAALRCLAAQPGDLLALALHRL